MQTAELDRSLIPPLRDTRAGALAALPIAAPALLKTAKKRMAFLYLGRNGGHPRFAYELAAAAAQHRRIDPLLVVSASNELVGLTQGLPCVVRTVRTFESGMGAFTRAYRIPLLLQRLKAAFDDHRTEAVVVVASHVWGPVIAPFLRNAKRPYIVVVHDADSHPGDITGLAHGWLMRDAAQADHVITLSKTVATALASKQRIPSNRIVPLFHPVMSYVKARSETVWDRRRPLRLLFFGRIMAYKGLGLFVEALELLRAQGLIIEATVAGEGSLNGHRERLETLGVTVLNRWLQDKEISLLLETHDAIVLTHIEASQSGCAAAALGAGRPVIATPVGGLVDQVIHEMNGLVAERVDAAAVAHQIARVAIEPALYRRLAQGVVRQQDGRGMRGFLDNMLGAIAWQTA